MIIVESGGGQRESRVVETGQGWVLVVVEVGVAQAQAQRLRLRVVQGELVQTAREPRIARRQLLALRRRLVLP